MANTIKALYVEILSSCNCRCTYCYNEKMLLKNSYIDTKVFTSILRDAKSFGLSQISISGGEPFLHPRIIDFINISVKEKIKLNIITNLTIFNRELYHLLVKHSVSLQVTIDGPNRELHDYTRGKGTFDRTIENLIYLNKHKYQGFLTIRINLHKKNYSYIENLFEVANSMNCKLVNLSLINKVGAATRFNDFIENNDYDILNFIDKKVKFLNNKYDFRIIFEGLNPSIGCPYYGRDNIECGVRISPDAYVFPCQLFTDKIFIIGNIKNNSLLEIVNGEKMRDFKTLLSLRKTFIQECNECAYQAMCATGCPAEAYNNNNNIFSNCGKCDRNKSIFNKFIISENNKNQSK